MKTFFRNMHFRLLALLAALALALAPGGAQAQSAYSFSQQELDQMLAPIALYPDALLSQILMAATYPTEVIEAARWSREHSDLSGEQAVYAAEAEIWDPSVKSLLAFPQVLARMRENLQWTQALGDAFLEQQSQVLDTVQALRRRAQAAGTLRSDERLRVSESGPSLLVQPVDAQRVYVPYYDPQIAYGTWWWPAYPPVYLRPWPGYYARPAYITGFYWGPLVGISSRFFFGAIDWPRRQVTVVHVNNTYYRNVTPVHPAHTRPPVSANLPGVWQHQPDHRRSVGYRSGDPQQRFGAADVRPQVQTSAPPPRDNVVSRPVNTHRFESFRQSGPAGTAAGAHASPTERSEIRREPDRGSGHAGEARIHRQWHANPQAARIEPGTRLELPRPPLPRVEIRPVSSSAREASTAMAGAARHEPAARREVPHASAPRAEIRPPHDTTRHEPGARAVARPR